MTRRSSDVITLLSRPPRFSAVSQRRYHTGLPINSLPGWELIPLNSKLPMLRCPNNQVIFSTHKIGQHVKKPEQEFTSIILEKMPEYRPLEDDHLRDFFMRSETLKLLRANGEITQNNDVICTLKDFNLFRRELDRYRRKVEKSSESTTVDRQNRILMERAEAIADMQYRKDQLLYNILHTKERRILLQAQKQERFERNWQQILKRIQKFQERKKLERSIWMQRKLLRNMNMEHHREAVKEIARRQSIKYKIFTRMKALRVNHVLAAEHKRRIRERFERLQKSWEKRLAERISYGKYLNDLVHEMHAKHRERVEMHMERHRKLWADMEQQLNMRIRTNLRMINKKLYKKYKPKRKVERNVQQFPATYGTKYVEFDELLDKDLVKMLENIETQENYPLTFDSDYPLYKAAEFIKTHVIRKFREDLSDNIELLCSLKSRLANFIISLKERVMIDAEQIIRNLSMDKLRFPSLEYKSSVNKKQNQRLSVQFSQENSYILGESYKIHSEVELQSVKNRSPTPKDSMASILMDPKAVFALGSEYEQLSRKELIYVEYCFAKYKQAVLVGVEGRVFNAIRLHFKGQSVQVQSEILDISEYYLINVIAHAILSSAVQKTNFQSSVFLGITMLSNKILYMLQTTLNDCGCQAKEAQAIMSHSCFLKQLYQIPEKSNAASDDSMH